MIKGIVNSIFLICAFVSFGQDTSKVQVFDEIVVDETRLFQRVGLYDEYELDENRNIRGFDQLDLYADNFSDEVWASENQDCIILSQEQDENDTYLKLHWNKDHPDCDWVGFGFGWDFWAGKDMIDIIDTAAVQLMVRSTGKTMGNLPWAMGFEDYAGGQAWIGFSSKFIEGKVITKEWTKVTIPLGLFPFEQRDCDVSNVKQMLFQVFAEDDLEINDVQIVPFAGKLKKEVVSKNVIKEIEATDQGLNWDWTNAKFEPFGEGHEFSIAHTGNKIGLAVKLNDKTPRMNSNKGSNLWKGDALEFAFATNPKADTKRTSFLLSDYHFGLNLGANPYVWNWSEDKLETSIEYTISEDGSFVEMVIPIGQFNGSSSFHLPNVESLSFEIAKDGSDTGETRLTQERWNSDGAEGFHTNPSLWGKLIF
ncbi:MAG: hypothetical protein P8P74_09060 [Crocinitomicaceae bacterium]|nr:hypothetical protein [Crocinitomicaceae bacterium]